jgi:hypothetical protein
MGADGLGGAVGVGGRTVGATGGATGIAEEGDAGGASAALRVTRTVSFFNGMLDVCLDGLWSGSYSLIALAGF